MSVEIDVGSLAASVGEIEEKRGRVREVMARLGLDAIWLRRVSSFAWATGGVSTAVNSASDVGVGELVVTRDGAYLVTNSIEAPRFEGEDGLGAQGWEALVHPWHEAPGGLPAVVAGMKVGVDGCVAGAAGAVDVSGEITRLRAALGPVEGARMRVLGRLCAEACGAAVRRVRPGMTEDEIAAGMAEEAFRRGVWPVVNLVATDERIERYRHPLPTGKRMDRHAMVVLCGRRWGLVCSVTRLVHVGPVPAELARRQRAVAEVDAALILASRPGVSLGQVLAGGLARYEACGFGEEWRLHHQGGLAGYEPREIVAVPGCEDQVRAGQAFAWNPSITGTKSEDTILVGEGGREVVTAEPGWPTVDVEIDGAVLARPATLVV